MTPKIHILKNSIQEYDWGSKTAIADFLGNSAPSEVPQAEIWMGAHPSSPSQVEIEERWKNLDDVIQSCPQNILGQTTYEKVGDHLPFLFKVLAAAHPLSIQAHPNAEQAKMGFEKENQNNIPLNAMERCYKDRWHKPEMLCALSKFKALVGFRKMEEIFELVRLANSHTLNNKAHVLINHSDGLKSFFSSVMQIEQSRKKDILQEVLESAKALGPTNETFDCILTLHEHFPDDIGVLAPLFLNLVKLEPGEAIALEAGILHSYLEGTGIELMANSDNVLRGGLTSKHVNLEELLSILRFEAYTSPIVKPIKVSDTLSHYQTNAEEYALSLIQISDSNSFLSEKNRSVEILVCVEGNAVITNNANQESINIQKGLSLLIPAALEQYKIEGHASIYKASVPS